MVHGAWCMVHGMVNGKVDNVAPSIMHGVLHDMGRAALAEHWTIDDAWYSPWYGARYGA